jgi:hypothetical protein
MLGACPECEARGATEVEVRRWQREGGGVEAALGLRHGQRGTCTLRRAGPPKTADRHRRHHVQSRRSKPLSASSLPFPLTQLVSSLIQPLLRSLAASGGSPRPSASVPRRSPDILAGVRSERRVDSCACDSGRVPRAISPETSVRIGGALRCERAAAAPRAALACRGALLCGSDAALARRRGLLGRVQKRHQSSFGVRRRRWLAKLIELLRRGPDAGQRAPPCTLAHFAPMSAALAAGVPCTWLLDDVASK